MLGVRYVRSVVATRGTASADRTTTGPLHRRNRHTCFRELAVSERSTVYASKRDRQARSQNAKIAPARLIPIDE
jgi:hypothetical protein